MICSNESLNEEIKCNCTFGDLSLNEGINAIVLVVTCKFSTKCKKTCMGQYLLNELINLLILPIDEDVYYYECRCGGYFQFSIQSHSGNITCDTCSLSMCVTTHDDLKVKNKRVQTFRVHQSSNEIKSIKEFMVRYWSSN